jgi:hypothetical protein
MGRKKERVHSLMIPSHSLDGCKDEMFVFIVAIVQSLREHVAIAGQEAGGTIGGL